MFHQTILFLFKTLHTTPRRHISLTKLLFCHLPTISLLLLPHFAITCQATASQKYNYRLCFLPPFTHCKRHLRKHMLSSAGSKDHVSWLYPGKKSQAWSRQSRLGSQVCPRFSCVLIIGWFWSMLFISFRSNYIRQLTFSNVLLFSCNPIGQLCWQPTWSISDLHHLR